MDLVVAEVTLSFFGMYKFVYQVFVFVRSQFTVEAGEEEHSSTQGPVVTLGSSHGVVGAEQNFEDNTEVATDEYQSSESSTESCVGRSEWERWQKLKEEVEGEEKQRKRRNKASQCRQKSSRAHHHLRFLQLQHLA